MEGLGVDSLLSFLENNTQSHIEAAGKRFYLCPSPHRPSKAVSKLNVKPVSQVCTVETNIGWEMFLRNCISKVEITLRRAVIVERAFKQFPLQRVSRMW